MNEYPKWVQRSPHIGPVLCLSEKEERELLNTWETEQAEKAEAEAKKAEAEAAEAKQEAQVTLKAKGK